jgi:hypothetical protein
MGNPTRMQIIEYVAVEFTRRGPATKGSILQSARRAASCRARGTQAPRQR